MGVPLFHRQIERVVVGVAVFGRAQLNRAKVSGFTSGQAWRQNSKRIREGDGATSSGVGAGAEVEVGIEEHVVSHHPHIIGIHGEPRKHLA